MNGHVTDLDQALAALLRFSPPRRHDTLASMTALLDLIGNPHERLRVVHVAGTSGKTSTAYHVRAILEASGLRTGLTVSPHIVAVNERVQVDGRPLPVDQFCPAVDRLLAAAAPLRGDLTYFELVIALALDVFARQHVDVAVVEVGVGGRDDATNVLRRGDKVSVITPIGLDHTEKLGPTVEAIARHKAGILVEGGRVVSAPQEPSADAVVRQEAERLRADLRIVQPSGPSVCDLNWALALAAAGTVTADMGRTLPSADALRAARLLVPPARYEWFPLPGGRRLVLDGAHNPQKLAGFVRSLALDGHGRLPVLATLTRAPDAKLADSLRALAPAISRLVVPEFTLGDGDKVKASFPAADVVAAATGLGLDAVAVPTVGAGLDVLLASSDPVVAVTGSLYLASLARGPIQRMNGADHG